MNPRKKGTYRHGIGRVYWSATLVALSVLMAALLLHNSFYRLAYYAVTTAAITALIFELKNHFAGRTTSFLSTKTQNTDSPQLEGQTSWKALIALFLLLVACVIMPLALAFVLPPEAWVILLLSFSTGVSLAEVFFYLSRR